MAAKNFWRKEPSSKLTVKTKCYQSCGCCDNSRSCEQLKKRVADKYFEKELDFQPKSPSVTGKVCYHYNSWVTGVYRTYVFHINSGGKIFQSKWLFESNLRSFGQFKCSTAFGLPLNPSCIGNLLQELAGCFRPRLSPDAQDRAFAKNGSCIQIVHTALVGLSFFRKGRRKIRKVFFNCFLF